MATILIDAKVYEVDDEEALHRGVACEFYNGSVEPVWSTSRENYMEAKVISECIKGRRFIRRSRVPLGEGDVFMDDPSKDKVDVKIIGLSEDVHEALEWHVEAFDNMEKELSYNTNLLGISRRRVDNLLEMLKHVQSENEDYMLVLGELQSLSLWGRIVRVFKGY